MPQIKYTDRANEDLQRFALFLQEVAPHKIGEALETIVQGLGLLERNPFAGEHVPCEAIQDLRKIVIPYGKNGYVALYRYDQKIDLVLIETIRHMLELEPDFLRKR